jgi:molecular chaperone DnaK
MLKEQITDKVDTTVDPMTAVAKGAALFASTLSVSSEVLEASRDKTKLQLEIKYEATTVEMDETITIKALKEKTTGTFPAKIYADVFRFDGGWSSGKKLIGEKATIIEVQLVEGRSNSFDIQVYDEEGNKLESQPNQFSILQGIGVGDMTTLPYHIGIGKHFHSESKDLFQPVKGLEKNKKIPATGVINGLKTRSAIRPGMVKDIIRIPIYQGDHNAEGTNPLLNNLINEIVISGESLPAMLPEGSDVDITIKVDRSEQMQFSAYFPLLNHTEELQVDIKATKPPTEEELTKEISKAKRAAQKVSADDVSEKLNALEEQLENEKGSADGKMKILDGLRKELLKLDSAEKTAEWPKVEQELKDAFFELEDLLEKIKANSDEEDLNMDKVEAHIQEYKKTIEQVIKEKNTKEAKHLISEIGSLDFNLRNAVTGNAMDVQFLKHIDSDFNTYHWKDKNKARQLVNQGLQFATAGNTSPIRQILIQVIALMPDDEKPKDTLG